MSQSQSSASADPRQRKRNEPEPATIEGVQMPSLSTLPSFGVPLYKTASEWLLGLDDNVLPVQREKQKERMIEAKKRGHVQALNVMSLDDWFEELEQRAKELLESTKEKWSLPRGMQPEYLSLTKTAMLSARCSPRDIVGIRTRLCFHLDHKAAKQNSAPANPLRCWTQTFCDKLGQLITHQAWSCGQPGGRASSLAIAIQYAVMLRTKDVREWDMSTSDFVITVIQDRIRSGMSAREAHASARNELLRSGDFVSAYHMSNVLQALEETVEERPVQLESDSLYYVTTEDLGVLIRALDGMTDPDTGCVNLPTAMYHKMALAVRPNRGLYPSIKELAQVHEQVMLEECRRLLDYERVCAWRERRGAASQAGRDQADATRNAIEFDATPAATMQTGSDNDSVLTPVCIPVHTAQTVIKVETDSAASVQMDLDVERDSDGFMEEDSIGPEPGPDNEDLALPARSRRGGTPYPKRIPNDLSSSRSEAHRATTKSRPTKRIKQEAESNDGER